MVEDSSARTRVLDSWIVTRASDLQSIYALRRGAQQLNKNLHARDFTINTLQWADADGGEFWTSWWAQD